MSAYPHSPWTFLTGKHRDAIPKILDEIANPDLSGPEMFCAYRKYIEATQAELAHRMGTTVTSVSRWESGAVPVSRKTMSHMRAIVISEISRKRGPLWYLFYLDPTLDPNTPLGELQL